MLDQIQSDLKQAQLDRDEIKTSTIRMLLSEIKNVEIAKGRNLTDEEVVVVVLKEVKKRKEGAEGFRSGGRKEQAQKEEDEALILQAYLPTQISDEELTNIVELTINELGATSLTDMGKVISNVMSKVTGQAAGSRVSSLVKIKLT